MDSDLAKRIEAEVDEITRSNIHCRRCGQARKNHAGTKCPFEPTEFEENSLIEEGEYFIRQITNCKEIK